MTDTQNNREDRELHYKKLRYPLPEEKYRILQRRFFGRKSEKISDTEHRQMLLVNEAEMGCNPDVEKPAMHRRGNNKSVCDRSEKPDVC